MIYVLEGADGTGKTTLANRIAEMKKASVLHSYFDPSWDIKQHHVDVINAAVMMHRWRPVVLDRWADSEVIYGRIFRNMPGYEVTKFLNTMIWAIGPENFTWILCRNDNAVKNHLKNMERRNEMFNDMSRVVVDYDTRIKCDDKRDWLIYDYDKVKVNDFVKGLPGENFTH